MRDKIAFALPLIVTLSGIASGGDNVAAGKDLFTSKCAMCHGADGSAKTAMGKKPQDSGIAFAESAETVGFGAEDDYREGQRQDASL